MKNLFRRILSNSKIKNSIILSSSSVITFSDNLKEQVKSDSELKNSLDFTEIETKELSLSILSQVIDSILLFPLILLGKNGTLLFNFLNMFRGYFFSLGNKFLKLKTVNFKGETPSLIEYLKRNYFYCLFTILYLLKNKLNQKEFKKTENSMLGMLFLTELYFYYEKKQSFGDYLSNTKEIQE